MTALDIGLAFDLRPTSPAAAGDPIDLYEELDSEETVEAIFAALVSLGHKPRRLGGGRALVEALLAHPPQLVFNLSEGRGSRSREAHVPALCELLGIPCTGSDPLTMALTLDKALTKRVVHSAGIRTAPFRLVEALAQVDALDLPFPLFVKPGAEGSSIGVRATSLVNDANELRREVERCLGQYHQPVLVEIYLPGAEATVAVVGCDARARVLGAMEIAPADADVARFVYGLEAKRNYQTMVSYHVPPRFAAAQRADMEHVALGAYRVLGCRDVARVDLRLDGRGQAYFIELNPLPGFNPVTGDICLIANGIGLSHTALVGEVMGEACLRYPSLAVSCTGA